MLHWPTLPKTFDPIARGDQRVLFLTPDDPRPEAGDTWTLHEWDPARPEAEVFVSRYRHRTARRAPDSPDAIAAAYATWYRLCFTGRACRVRILHVLADPDGAWLQPRVVAASITVEATWTEPPRGDLQDALRPMP